MPRRKPDPNSKRSQRKQADIIKTAREMIKEPERVRRAKVRRLMTILVQKIYVLRELERAVSLATDDLIPCGWLDEILDDLIEHRGDAFIGMTPAEIRAILCGHSHAGDEVTQ